jgi:hypothetical protein
MIIDVGVDLFRKNEPKSGFIFREKPKQPGGSGQPMDLGRIIINVGSLID